MPKLKKDAILYPLSSNGAKVKFADIIAKKNEQSVLKKLRKGKGYTLIDLGELTGLSPSYISRLEAGDRRYNSDILTKLSNVLGCTEYDLLKNDEEFNTSSIKESTYIPQKDLPVYRTMPGAAIQGGTENSFAVADFEEAEKRIFRLPQLMGIKSAFAFHVVDNFNAPKYRKGDLLFVNTEKPIAKHLPAVIVTLSNQLVIGELISWDDEKVEIEYFGSKKNFKFKKSEIYSVYSILGSFDNYVQ